MMSAAASPNAGALPKVAAKGTTPEKSALVTSAKSKSGGGVDKLPKLVEPPQAVALEPTEAAPSEEATAETAVTSGPPAAAALPEATATDAAAAGASAVQTTVPATDPTPAPDTDPDADPDTAPALAPTSVPPPSTLTPEEFGERQQRNAEFLVACGKYHKGGSSGDLRRAQTLFDRGVDVDFQDTDGWSALFYASGEGHARLVQWLVEDWGAAVDLRAPDECTPLWTACFNGKRDVVSYLLRIGADDAVVGKPPGEPAQSPAMAARRNRNPGIADFVDFEAELRRADPSRRARQVARQMTKEEFRESMRASPQFAAMDGGAA